MFSISNLYCTHSKILKKCKPLYSSKKQEERVQRLSQERANSVANYLIQSGVGGNRISAVGFGPSNPVASNATPEGRAQNRRVEVQISAVKM